MAAETTLRRRLDEAVEWGEDIEDHYLEVRVLLQEVRCNSIELLVEVLSVAVDPRHATILVEPEQSECCWKAAEWCK